MNRPRQHRTFLRHAAGHLRAGCAALLRRALASGRANVAGLSLELVTREHELASASESVRVAREYAERASGQKTRFLRTVSHEFRTPMTSLRLQLQTLERHRDELRPREQAAIALMLRSTSRLWKLIESLLEHARTQGGAPTLRRESFDLGEVVADVIDEQRAVARRKGLVLDADVSGDAPMVGDRRLVRVVIAHLIDNAVKFTDHGYVRVWIERGEDFHRVVVVDSGPGIPSADRARIFEAFEQVGPLCNKHHAGVGLGLTLVRDIVEELGGRIAVLPAVGFGSKFTIELPIEATTDSSPDVDPGPSLQPQPGSDERIIGSDDSSRRAAGAPCVSGGSAWRGGGSSWSSLCGGSPSRVTSRSSRS